MNGRDSLRREYRALSHRRSRIPCRRRSDLAGLAQDAAFVQAATAPREGLLLAKGGTSAWRRDRGWEGSAIPALLLFEGYNLIFITFEVGLVQSGWFYGIRQTCLFP